MDLFGKLFDSSVLFLENKAVFYSLAFVVNAAAICLAPFFLAKSLLKIRFGLQEKNEKTLRDGVSFLLCFSLLIYLWASLNVSMKIFGFENQFSENISYTLAIIFMNVVGICLGPFIFTKSLLKIQASFQEKNEKTLRNGFYLLLGSFFLFYSIWRAFNL